MKDLLKSIKFVLIAALVLVFASCLDKENVNEVSYTPEREAALIQELLDTLDNRGVQVDPVGGIYAIDLEMGDGETVLDGDTVVVDYTGYLVTGGIFDLNDEYEFVYGETSHIDGFDLAISLMNVGASGDFLIPSSLAYGSTGGYSIPPYTPLIFHLELVSISSGEETNE